MRAASAEAALDFQRERVAYLQERAKHANEVWGFLVAIGAASISPEWLHEVRLHSSTYGVVSDDDLVGQFISCVNHENPRRRVSEALWWRRVLGAAIRHVRYGNDVAADVAEAITKDANHIPLTEAEE